LSVASVTLLTLQARSLVSVFASSMSFSTLLVFSRSTLQLSCTWRIHFSSELCIPTRSSQMTLRMVLTFACSPPLNNLASSFTSSSLASLMIFTTFCLVDVSSLLLWMIAASISAMRRYTFFCDVPSLGLVMGSVVSLPQSEGNTKTQCWDMKLRDKLVQLLTY